MASITNVSRVSPIDTSKPIDIEKLKSVLVRASLHTNSFQEGDVNADAKLKFALYDLAETLRGVLEPRDRSEENVTSSPVDVKSNETQSDYHSVSGSEKSMTSEYSKYSQPPSEAECEYPPAPEHCLEKFEHLKVFGEKSFGRSRGEKSAPSTPSDYSVYSVPPSEADCEYPPLAEHCLRKFDFLKLQEAPKAKSIESSCSVYSAPPSEAVCEYPPLAEHCLQKFDVFKKAPEAKSFGSDYSVYSAPPSEAVCEYPPLAEHCLEKFDFLVGKEVNEAFSEYCWEESEHSFGKEVSEPFSEYCLEELQCSPTSPDFFLPSYFAAEPLAEYRCYYWSYPSHLQDVLQ